MKLERSVTVNFLLFDRQTPLDGEECNNKSIENQSERQIKSFTLLGKLLSTSENKKLECAISRSLNRC